jgi:hypothetical protein
MQASLEAAAAAAAGLREIRVAVAAVVVVAEILAMLAEPEIREARQILHHLIVWQSPLAVHIQ